MNISADRSPFSDAVILLPPIYSNQCALIPSEMLKVLGEANIFLKQIPLPGDDSCIPMRMELT
jgi:hypothetical protein